MGCVVAEHEAEIYASQNETRKFTRLQTRTRKVMCHQTRTRKFMLQNVTREWFCVVAYDTVCSAVLCQYNPVAFYCGMQMICMFIPRFCAYGNNQYTINHIRIGVNICFPIRVQ